MPCPPRLGHSTKQKSAKYTLKSRNQIIIKRACGKAYASWHFSIILISLRVEVAHISNFLVHAKILPLRKAFFEHKFTTPYTGQETHSSYFFV